MGAKTKIDWANATWNPVTGCLHGCEYCYARRIAERFGATGNDSKALYTLDEPLRTSATYEYLRELGINEGRIQPYPFGFAPTFHRYRLDEPKHWTKPRNIFVCSMADLFGEWVPDEWIKAVFGTCEAAPQHRYLFLTKNPARYIELAERDILPDNDNMWFGSTVTTPETEFFFSEGHNTFLSVEPILKPFRDSLDAGVEFCERTNWIIIGAETGNRKGKVIPEASWIMEIVQSAEKTGTPIFMKESLREIMGECFRQEYPWKA